MRKRIAELLSNQMGTRPRALDLQMAPLQGGLVSRSVNAVTARYRDGSGTRRVARWVIKLLEGPARREVSIYEALKRTSASPLIPSLIAAEQTPGGAVQLYLERLEPSDPWPWKEASRAACVLRALARLHAIPSDELASSVSAWNYDLELEHRADQLLDGLLRHRGVLQSAGVDVRWSAIRRIIRDLPHWRRQLLSEPSFGQSVIHGDVHPGNVMLVRQGTRDAPMFLDWERARLGSPLEDVSSWLQTLAFWEPEAKRRHDTLLGQYLIARGGPRLTRAARDLYWLSAASNCLAGSLLYHLATATSARAAPGARHLALAALRDQLRILRRADACRG